MCIRVLAVRYINQFYAGLEAVGVTRGVVRYDEIRNGFGVKQLHVKIEKQLRWF